MSMAMQSMGAVLVRSVPHGRRSPWARVLTEFVPCVLPIAILLSSIAVV
jgi:hypothetical protein